MKISKEHEYCAEHSEWRCVWCWPAMKAAQLNVPLAQTRYSESCATAANLQAFNQLPIATGWHIVPRPMTASDLGIVDQILDDKVGMDDDLLQDMPSSPEFWRPLRAGPLRRRGFPRPSYRVGREP